MLLKLLLFNLCCICSIFSIGDAFIAIINDNMISDVTVIDIIHIFRCGTVADVALILSVTNVTIVLLYKNRIAKIIRIH